MYMMGMQDLSNYTAIAHPRIDSDCNEQRDTTIDWDGVESADYPHHGFTPETIQLEIVRHVPSCRHQLVLVNGVIAIPCPP